MIDKNKRKTLILSYSCKMLQTFTGIEGMDDKINLTDKVTELEEY